MKYPKSIITKEHTRCYICGSYRWLEWHHVYGASNRKNSTKYGLVVPLCRWCHNEPPTGVHYNTEIRQMLQAKAQKIAMRRYKWTIEDFIKIFGKNFILD